MVSKSYEGLGTFYLGRIFDLKKKKRTDDLVLYDSKDLVTHAVCVGMTGSGKTGLCLALLEEAALDGIPAIVIDPKGDLPNLLLTFPDLKPEDFEPWINTDDAAKEGKSPAEFAKDQAELWRTGLADWGQDGERIKRLREAVDMAVYTPGSSAGLPVSILKSFDAPPPELAEDPELLAERISTTATSLLGLLGIEADPIKSREHILLSMILSTNWSAGKSPGLADLIRQIQQPPVDKIGVMDVESFFSSKDRGEFAMSMNNLLAAPGFEAWMEGEPLDIGAMLHTPEGKPRISIFSIAHLNDSERMFFVSLLLNQMLGWTRAQSGTTTLRAILYMDEIFGYFPPVAMPPSKAPLLTLLKQARAFGVGILLATQNPVDLDYKGLSNTGTWLIGRLQTERDKARVMEGLEGAAAGTGMAFDRNRMDQTLAGLQKRVFLINNVHEDGPEVFESRWAMSYLRGPLTRTQIKTLMDPVRGALPKAAAVERPMPQTSASTDRPLLPAGVSQFFIPVRGDTPEESSLEYRPMVFGAAKVAYVDTKSGVDTSADMNLLAPITKQAVPVDWDEATPTELTPDELESSSEDGAAFGELPPSAVRPASYDKWGKDFARWIYGSQKLELFKSPTSKLFSTPGESEGDFRARLQLITRESRDGGADALRKKYAAKMATIEDRLRRAQLAEEREATEAKEAKLQTAVSIGATVLGAFLGRKKVSAGTIGRATTAARGVGRSVKQSQDIGRARENVSALQQQLTDLNAEFEAEAGQMKSGSDPESEKLEVVSIKPKKANISVDLSALAWAPFFKDSTGATKAAW